MPVNTNAWQKDHPWERSPESHPEPVPIVSPSDMVNPTLKVADVMTRDIPSCVPGAPLREGARALRQAGAEAVFVLEGDKPAGVLTARAVARAVADRAQSLESLTVRDVMSADVPTVPADARLEELLDQFTEAGALAVAGDGRPQGIVRWQDLSGHLSERAIGRIAVRVFARQQASAAVSERKGG